MEIACVDALKIPLVRSLVTDVHFKKRSLGDFLVSQRNSETGIVAETHLWKSAYEIFPGTSSCV